MTLTTDIPVDLFLVATGEMRAVRSAKRKRKLNKRGDLCRWSTYLNCWLWEPRNIPPKLIKQPRFSIDLSHLIGATDTWTSV